MDVANEESARRILAIRMFPEGSLMLLECGCVGDRFDRMRLGHIAKRRIGRKI